MLYMIFCSSKYSSFFKFASLADEKSLKMLAYYFEEKLLSSAFMYSISVLCDVSCDERYRLLIACALLSASNSASIW